MSKIISFCGRCRAGKSELAKVCEKYGYKKLYFALPLKQLCADILKISVDELNRIKNDNSAIDFTVDENICKILSDKTDIPIDITLGLCNGRTLHTVREMLQFIGTDYIRSYNSDWHVNKIYEMLDFNTDYVFDDVRFQNEKKMIESIGGDCWFVTRTTLDNISNHESETSISWHDCGNKVIVNDSSLQELLFKWETFVRNYSKSCKIREIEFNRILESSSDNTFKPLSMQDVLLLHPSLFTYIPMDISKDKIESIRMNQDKSVFIKYKDDTLELVENPLVIEDLKKYI